ncbi:dentin sialophosphoprotein-like isoform X1 [Quercus lobata]|uniref:dentin sialophosphoprotein-like isoform X1 n=1 Tax=Quercus lobata TaxID=97700 RepID=UPI001248EB78|nr:dentin sialophosphoprotein-like isoform X1 [Quercus lobata]
MELKDGSGSYKVILLEISDESSSKHSETHSESLGESGSSEKFEIHPSLIIRTQSKHEETHTHADFIDRSGSSKHSETCSVVIDGSGSSKHSETSSDVIDLTNFIDGSGSSKHSETCSDIIDMTEVIDGTDSSNHSSIHQEDAINEANQHALAKKLGPTSSSDSSLEDVIQIIINKVPKSGESNSSFPNPNTDTPHEAIEEETDISSNRSTPVSDVGHESVAQNMSPTQSPKIQVMDRSVGYDPSRIPRSVFETSKSTTPMDWSVASNDSLFSLHVGNNSFSKDRMFLFGDFKSDELSKSGELTKLSSIPSVPKEEIDKKKIKIGGATLEVDENSNDAAKVSTEAQNLQNVPRPAVSRNSSSPSRNSDDTRNSAESFAFPVKTNHAKPSCYCSNCSGAFRYCIWQSCYFRWPSCYCSNCSWAFCYCWNCSRKVFSCHSSTIFAVVESTAVFNADEEQRQQQKPLSPKVASESTAKCWFPFLSWLQQGGSYCSRVHCRPCAHCC